MDIAEAVLFKVKSMQDARKRRRGLRLVIAGGATLVSAFLITFLLHVAGVDTNIPLYGLTTIGIGMLFTGMIFYMG
jgi:high-affinity Fe2+/Pb2+ permease